MARHSGFEPLAFGSGGSEGASAAVGSASQAVGIIRSGPAGGVHPSHPVAPVSRPFTTGLLPLGVDGGRYGSDTPAEPDPDASGIRKPGQTLGGVVPRPSGPYLTVREVAECLRVSTATIYEAVRRGEIPHMRVSNAIRIPASALP